MAGRTTQTSPVVSRERLLEMVRFALVGGSSTLLYMGVYAFAAVEGAPYGIAQLIAWVVSVMWGFVLHHRFTFRTGHSGRPSGAAGLWQWIGLQGAVMALNFVGLTALIHGVGISKVAAQAILLPFIPLITYVLSRRYVFNG